MTKHFNRRSLLQQGSLYATFLAMGNACSRNDAPVDHSSNIPTPTNLALADGTSTAELIASGEISALEAVEAAIDRAEQINPKINAIVNNTFDAARAKAKAYTDNPPDTPFAGVPTFTKDLVDVTGVPTEFGSQAFKGNIATKQFPFVDDLEGSGLVSLGKSSSPEFGLTATTEPLSSGITRNPWNLDHSSGGSSGGAAALVASGIVPLAHASDGGGSIRIPATCCGLVGLKVNRDRFRPAREEAKTPVRISVQGVETRTVRDTAAFLHAMQITGDNAIHAPLPMITGPSKERLKIGAFTASPSNVAVHPDVVQTIEQTATACAELGHTVDMISPPINDDLKDPFLLYWAAFADGAIKGWQAATGRTDTDQVFEPLTLGLQDHFTRNQDKISAAIIKLIGFTAEFEKAFGEYDLLLSPVTSSPAPPIGFLDTRVEYEEAMERLNAYAQFTAPANVAGTPALSLPMGQSTTGLPIGAQFHARKQREDQLLALAFELEAATPWAGRVPQVYAQ